jgi:LuxR family maltose regulon positive regulatory protein
MNATDFGWVSSLLDDPEPPPVADEPGSISAVAGRVNVVAHEESEQAPFRFDLLPRPHLEGQLAGVLAHAVTVLEAPAGYGKTATIWQWYQRAKLKGRQAVRINLRSRERQSAIDRLNAALHPIGVSIDGKSWSGVERHSLILVDDYPIDATAELDELFSALMNNLPSKLNVVVASRAPVRWALSKLLVNGDAQRLGMEDLRFTTREVEQYLDAYLPSADDLHTLESMLQGWQAALRVVRLSYERGAAARFATLALAPPDLAIRYVAEEVLAALPKGITEILIITAALERANAELLDEIRDADDSDLLLKQALELGAPFQPEDGAAGWYSLHPFVRACLAREVSRLGEIHRRDLHLRAQRWFLETGDIEAAAYHARMAGDPRKVFEMIEGMDGVQLAMRDGANALERVFHELPHQLLPEFPHAAIARSFLLAKAGRHREAQKIIASLNAEGHGWHLPAPAAQRLSVARYFLAFAEDRSEDGCDEQNLINELTQSTDQYDPCTRVLLNLALCNTRLRRGDLEGATNSGLEAEYWCKFASTPYAAFFAIHRLGYSYVYRNKLALASECLERAAPIACALSAKEPQLQLLADVLGLAVSYEQNDLEKSYRLLDRTLPRLHQLECSAHAYLSANLIASRMEYARNGLAPALDILDGAAQFGDRRNVPRLSHSMSVQRGDLLARAGRSAEALVQLAQLGVRMNEGHFEYPQHLTWLEIVHDGLVLGRALLASGDAHSALALSRIVAEHCERTGGYQFLTRCHLLQALACDAQGDVEHAAAAIRAALQIAVPEGAVRQFLDEREPMQNLLRRLIRVTGVNQLPVETVDFVAAILGARVDEPVMASVPQVESALASSSILSPREYGVLVELAEGHSNKVIARKLELTENTVKFHLRSLYEKLGVGCRVLAVAVAREKGILPS